MESKVIRNIVVYTCVPVLALGFFIHGVESTRQKIVRVAIMKDSSGFTMSIRGRYKITDPKTNRELTSGKRLRKAKVAVAGSRIAIGETEYAVNRLRISGQKDVSIYLRGKKRRYRGQIDIIRGKDNSLSVLNFVELESYVKGVLYHEVPYRWPLNAIKAQAIATRTYALYRVKERAGQEYDVTSDIYSQVYGGRSAERHRTNIAANRTRGKILTYNSELLPAYFHSTCGGHTENAANVWKSKVEPLSGIKCDFCVKAPYYQWKKNFRSKDIQGLLNNNGYQLGLIKTIEVQKRNRSRRIEKLEITARDGQMDTISGIKFRALIGPNVLKSNNYDIDMQGYYFDVIGRGWGHGVGLCQWGTYYMSKQRYKYTSILEYYYPGAKITKLSEL